MNHTSWDGIRWPSQPLERSSERIPPHDGLHQSSHEPAMSMGTAVSFAQRSWPGPSISGRNRNDNDLRLFTNLLSMFSPFFATTATCSIPNEHQVGLGRNRGFPNPPQKTPPHVVMWSASVKQLKRDSDSVSKAWTSRPLLRTAA